MRKDSTGNLLYVIPILAVVVCGLSLFLSEGSDFEFVRLMGGPTDTSSGFRGRLQVLRESRGTVRPVPSRLVRLNAVQGAHVAARTLRTGPEGWVEFSLSRRLNEPLELSIQSSDGVELARGSPKLTTQRWHDSARRRGGKTVRVSDGHVVVEVRIPRAIFSVPFEDEVVISVAEGNNPAVGAIVEVQPESATIEGENRCETSERGLCRFVVRPTHHVSTLSFRVRYAGKDIRFDQLVPIVPGAIGVSLGDREITLRSPIERDYAWYTFVTPSSRLKGGRVSLKSDGRGGAFGVIARDQFAVGEDAFLVVSGEADGRSPGTVGYPLGEGAETFDVVDAYLLDGAPVVRSRLAKRAKRMRWILGSYTGFSFLLTLGLFVTRVRRENRELSRNLSRVGAEAGTGDKRVLPLLIATLSLFFAFSAAVLWIVAR